MAADDSRTRIYRKEPGRENIRPTPCPGGIGVFPYQRMGKIDRATSLHPVLLMQSLAPNEVVLEQRGEVGGKGWKASFIPLTQTYGESLHLKIDVFDPEADGLHVPQAAPVEQFSHYLGGSFHEREDGGNFFAGHDHGDVAPPVGAHGITTGLQGKVEDLFVEEHQRNYGLVLCSGSDVTLHCQVSQECIDLGFGGEKVGARLHTMKPDESDDPCQIGAFRVNRVMAKTEHLPHFI